MEDYQQKLREMLKSVPKEDNLSATLEKLIGVSYPIVSSMIDEHGAMLATNVANIILSAAEIEVSYGNISRASSDLVKLARMSPDTNLQAVSVKEALKRVLGGYDKVTFKGKSKHSSKKANLIYKTEEGLRMYIQGHVTARKVLECNLL